MSGDPRGTIRRKWRPSLGVVVGGTLVVVLGLPVLGALIVGNALGRSPVKMMASLTSDVGLWTTGFVLLVTLCMGVLLWRLILGPVQALSAGAQAVAAGRSDGLEVLSHYGTRETEVLGRAVLAMGAALENRAAGLKAYSDHVTHELKSPLTTLQGAAELLQDPNLDAASREVLLGSVEAAVQRITALLAAMQTLARAREAAGPGGQMLLSDAVPEVPGLAVSVPKHHSVPMTSESLGAVLTHLCQNARAHGATRVEVAATDNGFDVVDDGPGITTGNRARVFDPFFTTRREGGGTGLGLSIARSFVETAGGTLTLAAERPDEGARFEVRF